MKRTLLSLTVTCLITVAAWLLPDALSTLSAPAYDKPADAYLGSARKLRAAYSEWKAAHEANGDRKSTRLNSSLTVISYAVFCLKKKKVMQEQEVEEKQPKRAPV